MSGTKQNFVLVFEENDDERFIDSELVRLCMNRFIIGEDNQNDIIGVFEFLKHPVNVTKDLEHYCNYIQEIIAVAKNSNPLNDQQSTLHFIIGSHFGVGWGWQSVTSENTFMKISTILSQYHKASILCCIHTVRRRIFKHSQQRFRSFIIREI